MKLAIALGALVLGAGSFTVTVLPRPSFPGPARSASKPGTLVQVSSRLIGISPVRITTVTGPPFRGLRPQQLIPGPHRHFVTFGRDGASARYLVAYDKLNIRRYAIDFGNYVWSPRIAPNEREFVYQQIVWAREAGSSLYVENAHSTYAKSSFNRNAYITAIDVKTMEPLWRSPALVANADNFLATDRYLVTGYGFTSEADYMYLLDRATGKVVDRLALPSAPERISFRGSQIVVRTYDHVVVARIAG